jgi:ribonuclease-3
MIYVDEKAARNNWNANPKLCEDVFEALIGAIYLDLGLVHAKRFILNIFENIDIDLEEVREFLKKFTHGPPFERSSQDTNAKDGLMQYSQRMKLALPEYPMLNHVDGVFTVGAQLANRIIGQGSGRTKKAAEQIAAHNALVYLGRPPPGPPPV